MYRVPDNVRVTYHQEGAVVLDIGRGQMFSLNSLGSRIVQLLAAGRDVPAIEREIIRAFAIDAQVARTDISEFLAALQRCNLLETLPVSHGDKASGAMPLSPDAGGARPDPPHTKILDGARGTAASRS
jgi:hypothetical protein